MGIFIGIVLAPFTLGFSLFFIFGGLMEFITATKKRTVAEKKEIVRRPRPKHPEEIQVLIDSLSELNIPASAQEKTEA
ncbi:hypothetical protein D3C84_1063370 [compost metagenome]